MAEHATVTVPASQLRQNILLVLKNEGYIRHFTTKEVRKGITAIEIELKYLEGEPAIKEIWRESKPGRRKYSVVTDLEKVRNGLGISVISTSKGIMSDIEARRQNLGGEVLFGVF